MEPDSEIRIRDAATLVALRDSDQGPEVLMMERTGKAVFAGGCWVFPGGAVEEQDWHEGWSEQITRPENVSSELALPQAERRSMRIAAIREALEEAGIAITDPCIDLQTLQSLQDGLNGGDVDFLSWCQRHEIQLPLDQLVLWSHWVTPRGEPRRFSARFYFVDTTERQSSATADGFEALAIRWVRPQLALEESLANRFSLMYPTVRQLQEIADFQTVAEILDWARSRPAIKPIHSRFKVDADGRLTGISLPGDDDYEDSVSDFPRAKMGPPGTLKDKAMGK